MTAVLRPAEKGEAAALAEVRTAFAEAPEAWEPLGNLTRRAQKAWIDLSDGGNALIREGITQTVVGMRLDLRGEQPTPLERLLAERIIACWRQVQYADRRSAEFQQKGGRLAEGEYWQHQQDRASRRFLRAIQALAQVRRLLTPLVQVNIAERRLNVLHQVPPALTSESDVEQSLSDRAMRETHEG